MKAVESSTSMANATSAPVARETSAGAKVASDTQMLVAARQLTQQAAPQDLHAAVKAAAAQIDSYLKSVGREVEFRVDEETGTTVVTVRATATGDVIRQIPNEEVLQLARRFSAGTGSLLDLTV
jgi:flagellar protein FlaG